MSGIETSEGEAFASLRCFRCGALVQCVVDCKIVDYWMSQCCFQSLLKREIRS